MKMNSLLENIEKIHTTTLGAKRIKQNLQIEVDDIVKWCKEKVLDNKSIIERVGKNYYVTILNYKITINAYSYTIITAHFK